MKPGATITGLRPAPNSHDVCGTYLDDYYAYYANDYANYVRYIQAGYAYSPTGPGYGHAMMMAMPSQATRKHPECAETVRYEEIPMRPAARRIPARREKAIPDKRIKAMPVD